MKQNDLPDTYIPDDEIQRILVDAGVECSLDNPKNHHGAAGQEPVCPLDLADMKLQALIHYRGTDLLTNSPEANSRTSEAQSGAGEKGRS